MRIEAQTTILYIDPPIIDVPIFNEFTVTLNIEDVEDLYSWEVLIFFTPSQIQCTGAEEGPFLRDFGPTIWPPPEIDNDTGTIHMGCALIPGGSGAFGSGVLAYIHFTCVNVGTSFIHIEDSVLTDSLGDPIPHSIIDSQVNQYQPETGYGPRANDLEILFYETEEQAFQALMANETDLMNTQVTDEQALEAANNELCQLAGVHHNWFTVPRHTWAVLISGGWDRNHNYARYWNDLGQCYTMLKQKGYVDSEIYVLYADGNSPSSPNCYNSSKVYSQYNNMVIDYAATKANLQKVCQYIQGNATPGGYDTLFVFVTDHGDYGQRTGYQHCICLWNHERINATEFAGSNYFGQITNISLRIFLMEQCYSGGFINSLADSKTVIATAAKATEQSYSCDTEGGYDEFSYHYIAALKGQMPNGTKVDADADRNGWVSLKEAFDYANVTDSKNENPQWSDIGNHIGALPEGHYALVPKGSNIYAAHYMCSPPSTLPAGPDNYWTFLRANTTTGTIRYGLAGIPESMNVITASSENEWDCLHRIYDTLLAFSPYDVSIKTGLRPKMAWNWQLEDWIKEVTNETLLIYKLANDTIQEYRIQTAPLIPYSETIYQDGSPLIRDVDYTIDYESGIVNFTAPPPSTATLTADYQAPCTKVVFYLRNNIFWHDGTPCTAEDVNFTIGYVKNFPEIAFNYHLVRNVHHVEIIDPYTIAVYEDILNPWALWWIGSLPIIPKHIFQTISDPTGYTPSGIPPEQVLIGCGPWRYQYLDPTSYMILTANRYYFLRTPPLGEIDYYMEVDYEPLDPYAGYQITILDIVKICAAYGSQGYEIPDENFDPGCDINPEGHACTINILDLVVACVQYSERWGTSGIPPS